MHRKPEFQNTWENSPPYCCKSATLETMTLQEQSHAGFLTSFQCYRTNTSSKSWLEVLMVQGCHSLQHGVQGTLRMLQVSSSPLLFLVLQEQSFEVSGCISTHHRLSSSFCGCYHSPKVFPRTNSSIFVFLPWLVCPKASSFDLLLAFSDMPLLRVQFSIPASFCSKSAQHLLVGYLKSE